MVVVGSVNLDHVVRVRALPPAGATVAASSYFTVPGGKGLNQAVTAARQGAPVRMVAAVGDDPAGLTLLGVLDAEGIDRRRVRTIPGEATGVALVTVADTGDNTVVVAAGANGCLGPSDVAPGAVAGCAVVLTQMEIPLEAAQRALEAGRRAGAFTILNPAPVSGPLPPALLGLVDLLIPNETEAATLAGERLSSPNPEAAAEILVEAGAHAVIVTLGERGALLCRDGAMTELPPFWVDAVDTTGAGDAFCGALAAGLAGGGTLLDVARRASAAGAMAASRLGAVPSLPSRADVDRLLQRR